MPTNSAAQDLDAIDRKILTELQRNGQLTNQELAERVALSPSPCLRRVRQLEQGGVIRQYVALVDPLKIGLGLLAYVNVRLDKRDTARAPVTVSGKSKANKAPIDDFAAAVQAWPEVVACYAMTGDMDYLLRVHVQDLEHFSHFVMERLMKHPSVTDVRSSFALQRIKDTTALPV